MHGGRALPRRTMLFLTRTLVYAGLALLCVAPALSVPGTARRMELEDLVRVCDLAVEGRVVSMRAVRDVRGRIVTEHVLHVRRTHVGLASTLRTVRLPGGTLPDGTGLLVPGMPRLEVGQECVLFLSSEDTQGTRMPVGLAQGAWRVTKTKEGLRRVTRAMEGLAVVDGARVGEAETHSQLDYAVFVARVEAAKSLRPVSTQPVVK